MNEKAVENTVQLFNSEEFGTIRSIMIDMAPWFVGRDVATALGYAKPENAIAAHVFEEDKTSTLIQGSGSNYKSKTIIINESGLYALVMNFIQIILEVGTIFVDCSDEKHTGVES